MRIVAERDTSSQWQAWWADQPEETFVSPRVFGAVVTLLAKTGVERGVSVNDLQMDFQVSVDNHMEFFVKPGERQELFH